MIRNISTCLARASVVPALGQQDPQMTQWFNDLCVQYCAAARRPHPRMRGINQWMVSMGRP